MATNIKVAVRVRPLLPAEKSGGHSVSLIHPNPLKREISYRSLCYRTL